MTTDSRQSRPGGRSADVKRRVFGAIQNALEQQDWGSLAIGDIAELAGVNKTTIYRRWSNKEGLIADLLDNIADSHPPPPDCGDITEDLTIIGEYLAEMFNTPFGRSIVVAVVGSSEEDLGEAARRYWTQLLDKLAWVVRRAMDRGQLKPETRPSELVESIFGPIYLRILFNRQPIDREAIRQIVQRAVKQHLAGS